MTNGKRHERAASSPRHQQRHAAAIARATGMTLLTLAETAARFRVSRRTLQGQLDGVPYLCVGRKKLFGDVAVLALVEKFRLRSPSSPEGWPLAVLACSGDGIRDQN